MSLLKKAELHSYKYCMCVLVAVKQTSSFYCRRQNFSTMGDNGNITAPTRRQLVVLEWMINDTRGGFQEDILSSQGGSPQVVSISREDMRRNPELEDAIGSEELTHATIDRQVNRFLKNKK